MTYIDTHIKKTTIINKGTGFIAVKDIPINTIIIKELPFTIQYPFHSDMFQLLYNIFTHHDINITKQFKALSPKNLSNYIIDKTSILQELTRLKLLDSHIYNFFIESFSTEDILLYCAKYICNGFNIDNKPAILFNGTLLNHSCLPNVIFKFDGIYVIFMSIIDIKAGEEICDNYIDITQTKEKRKHLLKTRYGFDCACARCVETNKKISKRYDRMAYKIKQGGL